MAKEFQEFGKHYLVEFVGCDPKKLKTVKVIKAVFLEAARLSGATMLGSQFHQFKPQGMSAMIFIAESHFSIHTWPERDGATLDVYVCNFTADNTSKAEEVYDVLLKALKPADVMVERVMRGRDLPLKKRVA